MDDESRDELESEDQFWSDLGDVLEVPCDTHEQIDNVLRSFLAFTDEHKQTWLQSEYDVARCCYKLLDSELFKANQEYIRRQILYCLLQEDGADVLHLATAILLFHGRATEVVFETLQAEGAFPRIVQLIHERRDDDIGLHRLLIELMYEMSRVQKLSRDDLMTVHDSLVLYFFQLIEQLSDDVDDPYHYPIIRVLLVLNEQYMCLATAQDGAVTNRILKLLSLHGPTYRTFGENLILLLNRESTFSAQLLILKLLYLLFTTPSTYEYFYTNDLHVLVDVIIRNLLDLDHSHLDTAFASEDGQVTLRHTYLRVLCPLLRNTQLSKEGSNYKREDVRKLLHLLANRSSAHFGPVDETVLRLVMRCKQIEWIKEKGDEQVEEIEQTLSKVAPRDAQVAKHILGMSLEEAGVSNLSVADVSAKVAKERPRVPAPRRNKKKTSSGMSHTNGTATSVLLSVPSDGSLYIEEPLGEGGRSPFSDENTDG